MLVVRAATLMAAVDLASKEGEFIRAVEIPVRLDDAPVELLARVGLLRDRVAVGGILERDVGKLRAPVTTPLAITKSEP